MKTLLKNVKLVNVFTETIEETNVLIDGEIVAGVGTYYTSEDADECREDGLCFSLQKAIH